MMEESRKTYGPEIMCLKTESKVHTQTIDALLREMQRAQERVLVLEKQMDSVADWYELHTDLPQEHLFAGRFKTDSTLDAEVEGGGE